MWERYILYYIFISVVRIYVYENCRFFLKRISVNARSIRVLSVFVKVNYYFTPKR